MAEREINKPETKEHEKRAESITNGKKAKTKKSSKVIGAFIGEDAGNVGTYILHGILIPSIKKAVSDIVVEGVRMVLGTNDKKNRSSSAGYVSYRSYSDDRDGHYRSSRSGRGYDFDNVVFDTRGEAEEVLDRMDELIDTYRSVSVADLYDLSNVSSEYTDHKYGWTSLRSASVERTRDGYVIRLPRATAL